MTGRFVAIAALVLGCAMPTGAAFAQYYPVPPSGRAYPYHRDYGPPPGYWLDDDEEDLPPRATERYQPLPPPGVSGHAPSGVPGQASANPEAPRPPASVTGSTPPANSPITNAALPVEDQPEEGEPKDLPPELKRQMVDYPTKHPAGTIIIDTAHTYLYLTLGGGKAIRYGIGVGREGFTWAGTERVSRMAEWPDWHPPAEMIERQPYLPRFMAGGPGNPLGARALYLGKTLYRIHGTNQPSTIGKFVSSGCIRLLNSDIEDLYSRVTTGTRVVVVAGSPPATASAAPASGAPMSVTPSFAPSASASGASSNVSGISASPLPPPGSGRR
jgi:lipoprotein-anchoring transpeptidase ErfK/SrfK